MYSTQFDASRIKNKTIIKYLIIGICFGACFPVGAMLLEAVIKDISMNTAGIMQMHSENPLLYMIDSAPIFLGLFALLGGISKAKAEIARAEMEVVLGQMKATQERNLTLLKDYEETNAINEELNNKVVSTSQVLYENSENLSRNMKALHASDTLIGKTVQSIDSHVEEMEAINKSLLDQFKCYDESIELMYESTTHASGQMESHLSVSEELVSIISASREILSRLSEEAKEVETVVSLIADISGKIKLLALNASIESARAGDAGKGFAVVANEIKILSEQTDEATDQIAQTIQSVTTGVFSIEQRMLKMDEEGKVLQDSNMSVSNEFKDLFDNIKVVRESSKAAMEQMHEQNETLISVNAQIHDVAQLTEERESKMAKSQEALSVNEEQIELLNTHTGS